MNPLASPSRPSRPNFVVVCVDQMRFDAMGIAGNKHIDTPNLDDLAARGYHFTNAYSATPTCVPARVGLFTGQGPEEHGRYGYRDGVPFTQAYPQTFASILSDAGYHTFAVGKMHVFPDRSRCGFHDVLLHDGFLHYSRATTRGASGDTDDYVDFLRRELANPRSDYTETGIGCNQMAARPWEHEERLHPTRWVADESLHFLKRRDPTKPFLLYMSFHRPHAPFDPPQWLWDKYREREFPARPVGEWVSRFDEHKVEHGSEAEFADRKESVHHDVKAGYYGNIDFIDQQINRLNETLSDLGLAHNTVIIFVSDHGDMMGDHDLYRKSVAYEGSSHIPLIMAIPPAFAEGWGARGQVDSVVEIRDIMPTLLDLAGVEIPESVSGVSLRGATRGEAPREYLHGEHVIGSLGYHSMQWIRSARYKYIWFSGDGYEQLFDLESDPHELHSLAEDSEYAQVLEEHRAELIRVLADREEGYVSDGALVAGQRPRSEASWVADLADQFHARR